ncbi:limb region 1 protein homolog isoform X1 [Eptesicus fuscus]|uniref:limb region 1 protein homolog isoform X1 n=1 Tax=Eptesicus fuscus TaxID=29078 RepID=UPI002403EA3C|nr:limb region 1 protein homolog isoform X1 [Eptesicus fuscus]
MEGQDEVSAREQHFHSQVRESTICFLLFAILYIVSYFIITRYKRKSDEQEDEDAIVNRISLFLCTFTLAVSAGAVLLLPFSIISNEILLSFPHNYYIQWLNGSLIHGLWNLASLFSNLCLFVLMPFAFFFLESEGFAGLKKGLRARILETLVMLLLLALLILGMVWVASALVDKDAASRESLYDLWEFYLPYLYSCVSLMGCLLLLLCTPVGLSRMFAVMGQLLVKPAILEDLDEQMYIVALEEEALQRRLTGLSSSVDYNVMELEQELENVKIFKTKLERRKKASAWERNLVYPAVMVLLLIETGSISCTSPGRPGSRTAPSRLPTGTRRSCEAAAHPAQTRERVGHHRPRRGDRAHFLIVSWEPAGRGFQPRTHVCSVGTATRRQPGSGLPRTRPSPGPAHAEAAGGTWCRDGGGQGRGARPRACTGAGVSARDVGAGVAPVIFSTSLTQDSSDLVTDVSPGNTGNSPPRLGSPAPPRWEGVASRLQVHGRSVSPLLAPLPV